jgi:ferric-dicitrate binding protein FerR (iron transport regulator)
MTKNLKKNPFIISNETTVRHARRRYNVSTEEGRVRVTCDIGHLTRFQGIQRVSRVSRVLQN